jgi:hypothetical protein
MGKARFNEAKSQIFGKEKTAFDKVRRTVIFDAEKDPREMIPSERRKIREMRDRVTPEREIPQKDPTPVDTASGEVITPTPEETKATTDQTKPLEIETKKETTATIVSDTALQNLIRAIPYAAPGALIRDEYHNTLRAAVVAIAERLGLSVNQNVEFGVLNFAPNFLPVISLNNDGESLNWLLTGEGAIVPPINAESVGKAVVGASIVSLPDLGDIHELVVWVGRDEDAPPPKEFNLSLQRKRLGSDDDPQTLIEIDLRNVKEGVSEMSAVLSEREIPLLDEDEGETGKMTLSRRKIINNEKWVYFVLARFLASAEMSEVSYAINLIQISCNI